MWTGGLLLLVLPYVHSAALAPVIEVGDEGFDPSKGKEQDSLKNRCTLLNAWRSDARAKFTICENTIKDFDKMIYDREVAAKGQLRGLKQGDPQRKILMQYCAELTAYAEGPMRQFKDTCSKLEGYLHELDLFEVQTRDYYGAGPGDSLSTGLGQTMPSEANGGLNKSPDYTAPAASPAATPAAAAAAENATKLVEKEQAKGTTELVSLPARESAQQFKRDADKKEEEFRRKFDELQAKFSSNPLVAAMNKPDVNSELLNMNQLPPAALQLPPAPQADAQQASQQQSAAAPKAMASDRETELINIFKKEYNH